MHGDDAAVPSITPGTQMDGSDCLEGVLYLTPLAPQARDAFLQPLCQAFPIAMPMLCARA